MQIECGKRNCEKFSLLASDGVEKVWSWLHRAEFQLESQAEGPVVAETRLSVAFAR
jgi:hypothetical protein